MASVVDDPYMYVLLDLFVDNVSTQTAILIVTISVVKLIDVLAHCIIYEMRL